jgi:hypothetical protein
MKKRDPANLIVDIIVTNGQIRALRPVVDSHNAMPHTEPEKSNWLKTVNPQRINMRILGGLGKTSLSKAQRLVNYQNNNNTDNNDHENNNTVVECGSIFVYEEDFVRLI